MCNFLTSILVNFDHEMHWNVNLKVFWSYVSWNTFLIKLNILITFEYLPFDIFIFVDEISLAGE
jgi:hypothetical protein